MEEVVIPISGMHCDGCVRNVTGLLAGLPGVGAVAVDLSPGQARVAFNPAEVGLDAMRDAIEAAGFDVGEVRR